MLRSEDSLAEPKVTILPPDSLKPSEDIGGSGCSAFGAVGARGGYPRPSSTKVYRKRTPQKAAYSGYDSDELEDCWVF